MTPRRRAVVAALIAIAAATSITAAAMAASGDAQATGAPQWVAPAGAAAWRPPVVLVNRGVDVDQDQAQEFAARLAADPRGWRQHLDGYAIRIVRTGTEGTEPMPGRIGHALTDVGVAIISEQAWTTLGPRLAASGGTLDDQRAWIILHELGHLISRDGTHPECPGPGDPAPVMRAVSYDIGECRFNIWPNP